LRRWDFSFTLDGFGRGISSFAYLKSLDVTYVKIDHAAIARGQGDDVGDSLLRSLHQINKVLDARRSSSPCPQWIFSSASRRQMSTTPRGPP